MTTIKENEEKEERFYPHATN